VIARIRTGSRFKQFLCFVVINARCSRILPVVHVPQVEETTNEFVKLFTLNLLDRLCGLVVIIPDYRSGGPGLRHGATIFSEK
jgi:hypothetical protein